MKGVIRGMMLTGLMWAAPATAAPCSAASAAGIWALVSIQAAEPGVEDFYKTAPHEIMRFRPDGHFMYLASSRPIAPAEAGQRLDAADARDGASYRYTIGRSGQMLISRQGTPFQAFQCNIADRAENGARAGDMILTNAPGANRLRRVQRKVR